MPEEDQSPETQEPAKESGIYVRIDYFPPVIVGGQPRTNVHFNNCTPLDVIRLCATAIQWATSQIAQQQVQAAQERTMLNVRDRLLS